jgi:UDP-N-acetylmuramate dehydrogenase
MAACVSGIEQQPLPDAGSRVTPFSCAMGLGETTEKAEMTRDEFHRLLQSLSWELQEIECKWHEPLSRHTTFRVGGPACCLVRPKTERALVSLLAKLRERSIPHFILGGGSNLLLPDEPWDGVAIKLSDCCAAITTGQPSTLAGPYLHAGAGIRLARLLRFCLDHELSGVEFLVGIPGTVGGALFMNAGTGAGSMADALVWVDVLDQCNHRRRIDRCDLTPKYRSLGLPEDWVILGACLETRKTSRADLQRRMAGLMQRRRASQPHRWPSAGCIYKNPEGASAGALIEKCGLKGFRQGDAEVSHKHGNWIINRGHATARDILGVMAHVEDQVYRRCGVRLERELRVMVP